MKKILSAILCICMIFTLCACAGQETSGGTEPSPPPTQGGTASSGAPADGGDAPVEAYGAELGDRVIIQNVKTIESFNAPDNTVILLFSYVTPVVRIEERREVAEAINEQICLLDEAYISGSGDEPGKNQILEDALDNFSYVTEKNAELGTSFSAARTAMSTRADGSVISFRYWTSVYTGGPSGRHGYKGVNFSSETGKMLTLDALSSDPDALKQALTEGVIAAAQDDKALYAQISEFVSDPDEALAAIVREGYWYFSAEGIVFFPDFGELRPDDQGLPFFTVPYENLVDALDKRFLPVKREGEGAFSVVRLEDVQDGTVQSVDLLSLSDGDALYLKVDGVAYDVALSSFFYVHQAEGDERFQSKDLLWYSSYMNDCALQIQTKVPNGMPDLMITYTDADYVFHRLFISQSGEGNGVTLVDDTIEAVG